MHLSASNGQLNVRLRFIFRSRFVLLLASNGQLNVRLVELTSFLLMTSVFRFMHLSASNGQLNVRLRVYDFSRFVLLSASNGQLNVRLIRLAYFA